MMKKMKKFSALFLSLLMVLSIYAGTKLNASAAETGSIHVTKYQITDPEVFNNLTERANGKQIADDNFANCTKLQGVTFRVTKVVDKEGLTTQNYVADSAFTPVELTTDANGKADFTNLPLGIYLLEETKRPAEVTRGMEPVLISIPMPDPDDETQQMTDIYVYPKNLSDGGPTIEKDVVKYANNDAGVNRNESFSWIITASIPEGIATAKEYIVTDSLDTRLDFDADTKPVVTVDGAAMTENTDYTFSAGAENRELAFSFTEAGRTKMAAATEKKVTITFNTKVNETAELGVSIPNTAKLDYTNESGSNFKSESDTPEVHTGGYTIRKIDKTTKKPLAGAVFAIYATEADATNKVNPIQTAKSTEDEGLVMFDGLAYGDNGVTTAAGTKDYWIAELEAPVVNGVSYKLLKDPVKVTITATSHEVSDDRVVENEKGDSFGLPFTGGIGTTVFILGGAALLGAAYVLIVKDRKKQNV